MGRERAEDRPRWQRQREGLEGDKVREGEKGGGESKTERQREKGQQKEREKGRERGQERDREGPSPHSKKLVDAHTVQGGCIQGSPSICIGNLFLVLQNKTVTVESPIHMEIVYSMHAQLTPPLTGQHFCLEHSKPNRHLFLSVAVILMFICKPSPTMNVNLMQSEKSY